ncbi:MAG: leucyl aminopeptidase [Acidobacteria bacterium]|nr:leucyl aminopeptidase [Acidobacteriota bacterium]
MFTVKLSSEAPELIEAPALATWVFEQSNPLDGPLAELDQKAGSRLKELVEAGELTGKAGETLLLHYPAGFKTQRLLLLGAGKPKKFSPAIDVRQLAGLATRFLKARKVTEFTFWLGRNHATPEAAQAVVEGVLLANFDPASYRTNGKKEKPVADLQLVGFDAKNEKEVAAAVQRGQVIAEAQNFARELANEPSNRLTPRLFAERATAMARDAGLELDVLDEARLRELKMGALLSVAQGSAEPPRLVVLTYTPPTWKQGQPVLGLVGKGITFDTGGISIKPSDGMEKMKYDMAGGATMAGAMRALAVLKPAHKIIALIPLAENMPGSRAQKPGDVQIAMSGKSIEVINTDAEGRLVLADALTYARQLGATHLIDAATLTGAVVVALGYVNVGTFGNNQKFLDAFLASGRAVGEKFWVLPVDDDYRDNIKSAIADIQNVGKGRGGGATNAAIFLKEFVDDTPWIHLDIAGTAWLEEAKPGMAKGPSGVAVRTLIHFAEHFSPGA